MSKSAAHFDFHYVVFDEEIRRMKVSNNRWKVLVIHVYLYPVEILMGSCFEFYLLSDYAFACDQEFAVVDGMSDAVHTRSSDQESGRYGEKDHRQNAGK
ncbi:MAG TPA: hypothetical protein DCZ95_13415 [Verrucomicrobia bacterium]|nr:MAG: hypothetical protein A2X46_11270 [Lentisphaerae bacterium GWF2_57_35]HBA85083.1 hypothetical protein [Verrucomicrobiota bacterium]